ncbi:hypothetical protein F3Y22_tig00111621pilonHSYRG00099 [Hibiscus syriacus]|uniref:RNase H type-1 domain-containing protein n=1 Tax=Hibiscus syriacus TaxID=106335 RepID=A0A6A2XZS1_HIBSY|nr:hypothetical protein F3Y22_tig00111621pilonHSYRG00099 [Hibiscus syriacus]
MDFKDWMVMNLGQAHRYVNRFEHWDILFGYIIWNIWLHRNSIVFNSPLTDCRSILERSRQLTDSFVRAWVMRPVYQSVQPQVRSESRSWQPPLPGWLKMNSDGARSLVSGHSMCGGVIRSLGGDWRLGFTKFIGICLTLGAEVRGIYLGLLFAWNLGGHQVVVEVDSLEALKAVRLAKDGRNSHTILNHIRELLQLNWVVKFQHVASEGNKVADRIAKLATAGNSDAIIFHKPPDEALTLLQLESSISS